MKATEQYFPVVLFITLYKVALTLGLCLCDCSNKATEPYFPVVLVFILYTDSSNFEFVDEIVKCH